MIYNSISDNVIIELLYNQLTLEIELHLVNLSNHIQGLPLIDNINKMLRFKRYCSLFQSIEINEEVLKKYPKPYYDIEEIKQFIKMHYNMYEVRKNDRLVAIIINKQVINIQ